MAEAQTEEQFLEELNRKRIQEENKNRKEQESIRKKITNIAQSVPGQIGIVEIVLITTFAIFSDTLDFLFIGSLPVVGDIIDIGTWAVIWMWRIVRDVHKPPAWMYLGLIELFPFVGDLPPTWVIMVVGMIIYHNYVRRGALSRLRAISQKVRSYK